MVGERRSEERRDERNGVLRCRGLLGKGVRSTPVVTLVPHQLRHGTASLLLNQNVPIPAVSRYLGHANAGVTMKV